MPVPVAGRENDDVLPVYGSEFAAQAEARRQPWDPFPAAGVSGARISGTGGL
jgi:hypothetical protein